MKFYALVILPITFVDAGDDDLRVAVQELMAPFGQEQCEAQCRVGEWDWYWCCDKSWLAETGFDTRVYPSTSSTNQLLVLPAHTLTAAGVPAVLLTPDGRWHSTAATLRRTDPLWPARALAICEVHAGHPAVLVFAHN